MPVGKLIAGQKIVPQKLERARQLRKQMTPAEKLLWEELRGNKLGPHFRRQQIISGFIVDFYCHAAGLVIELDGAAHGVRDTKESDSRREAVLRHIGLRIVRFKDGEVSRNLPQVLGTIRELIRRG
jgi:very-short-patch-repair endonuclease